MPYALRFDGASKHNPGPSGSAWVLVDLSTKKVVAWQTHYLGSNHTNNEAEYTALRLGLEFLESNRETYRDVCVQGDSKLVVMQVQGKWKCKAAHLRASVDACKQHMKALNDPSIEWIPRDDNVAADRLANLAIETKSRADATTHETGVDLRELLR